MVICPLFSVDGWECEWNPRVGHRFVRPDMPTILVRRGDFDGQLVVQRTLLDRVMNFRPEIYGYQAGGYQGGGEIELFPKWSRETRLAMDGTMLRHPVGIFTAEGQPTTGAGLRYALEARKLPNGYEKIDGPHLIRAYRHAVAQWKKDRDPAARMFLILCAFDVLRRFPLVSFADGDGGGIYSLASMERNVAATPHQGALGITRENAWCLRCVVEAYRAAPSPLFAEWIRRFVAMLDLGQSYGGALERHGFSDGLAEEQDDARRLGVQPDEEWCTSWQTPFLIVAVNEARKLVPTCAAAARNVMVRVRPWWREIEPVAGDVYDGNPTAPGLPRYLIVAKGGRPFERITRGVGPARAAYDGFAFQAFSEVGL